MTVVFPLARLLPNRGVAALLPGDVQVAVFRTNDDQVYALSNIDPFARAAVLSRGIVGDRGGVPVAVSPVYKNAFDLRTGVCVEDPDVSVEVYPVRVAAGMVMLGHVSKPPSAIAGPDAAHGATAGTPKDNQYSGVPAATP